MVSILLSLKSITSTIHHPLSGIIFILRGADLPKTFINKAPNCIFKCSRSVFLFNSINYKERSAAGLLALLDYKIYINSTYRLKLH